MKAEAIYVVVTQRGYVSEPSIALTEEDAARKYVLLWLPDHVRPTGYVLDQLWQSFKNAGYTVTQIQIPKELDGREVCRT